MPVTPPAQSPIKEETPERLQLAHKRTPDEFAALRITLLYLLIAALWLLCSDFVFRSFLRQPESFDSERWNLYKSLTFVAVTSLLLHMGVRYLIGAMRKSKGALRLTQSRLAETEAQSEAALRESEVRFRSLLEHAMDPLFICELSGSFVTVNRRGMEALGYSPNEIKDLGLTDILADPEPILQSIQTLQPDSPAGFEACVRRHDGTTYLAELRAGLIHTNGNRLAIVLVHDITRRKRSESERGVYAMLGESLAAGQTMEQVAEKVHAAVEELWPNVHAMFVSCRRSGRGHFRMVLEMDTINGIRRFYPAANYDGSEHRGLEQLHAGQSLLVNREADDEAVGLNPFGEAAQRSASLMYAPIIYGGRLVGLISVQSYDQNAFTERDLKLLERICDITGPAMERCRAEAQRRAFAELGQKLSAARTPEEAARTVVDVADELLGWDACLFDLYFHDEDRFQAVLAFDVIDGQRAEVENRKLTGTPGGLMRRTLDEGPLLILREPVVEAEPVVRSFGDSSRPSASLMWTPVRGVSGVIGLLTIQSYTYQAYDEEDLQLLTALADHCTGAMERTRAEESLRLNEERYRLAISESGSVLYERRYHPHEFVYVGDGIQKMIGYAPHELTVDLWDSLVEEVVMQGDVSHEMPGEVATRIRNGSTDEWRSDVRIKTRDGQTRWIYDTSIQLREPSGIPYGSLGILQDITSRKRNEEQLVHNAFHDSLTGLPNRSLLMDRLEQALGRAHRGVPFFYAVLFLDLDRFKSINDSLGHLVGDEVLRVIAGRLAKCVRAGDTIARFGGDEFAIVLEEMESPQEVKAVAEKIQQVVAQPVTVVGREVFTSASIGIVIGAQTYSHAQELLRDADSALHRAKALGKARYETFDSSMHEQAMLHLELENDLRRAVTRDELHLHYQPILSLETGLISGFEALLRWNHPERGHLGADIFVPLAEETGLIRQIGWNTLRQACRQLRRWRDMSCAPGNLHMNVNLSARQFSQPDLNAEVLRIVSETGVDPHFLRLEITETAVLENPASTAEQLKQLKLSGFQIYLDDFGTGYSSLSYLHQLPIDGVKIDRSFISRLHGSNKEREIVRSIIIMAATLGIDVTAEGVSTLEQLAMLREMNCGSFQGFLFSTAVDAERAEELLLSSGSRRTIA